MTYFKAKTICYYEHDNQAVCYTLYDQTLWQKDTYTQGVQQGQIYYAQVKEITHRDHAPPLIWLELAEGVTALLDTHTASSYQTGSRLFVQVKKIPDEPHKKPVATDTLSIATPFLAYQFNTNMPASLHFSKKLSPDSVNTITKQLEPLVDKLIGKLTIRTRSLEWLPYITNFYEYVKYCMTYVHSLHQSLQDYLQQASRPKIGLVCSTTSLIDEAVLSSPPNLALYLTHHALRPELLSSYHLIYPNLIVSSCSLDTVNMVEAQYSDLMATQHNLASGANILIEQTSTLTAIDVNTAHATRVKTKLANQSLHFALNQEAIITVAQLICLQNITGIVVIDLLKLKNSQEINALNDYIANTFNTLLGLDGRALFIGKISPLGLLELSREDK